MPASTYSVLVVVSPLSVLLVITGIWSPIKILASLPGIVMILGVARIFAFPVENRAVNVA